MKKRIVFYGHFRRRKQDPGLPGVEETTDHTDERSSQVSRKSVDREVNIENTKVFRAIIVNEKYI